LVLIIAFSWVLFALSPAAHTADYQNILWKCNNYFVKRVRYSDTPQPRRQHDHLHVA